MAKLGHKTEFQDQSMYLSNLRPKLSIYAQNMTLKAITHYKGYCESGTYLLVCTVELPLDVLEPEEPLKET